MSKKYINNNSSLQDNSGDYNLLSKDLIKLFGTFGLINFLLFHFLWNHLSQEEYSNIPLRLIAAFLCFLLIISDYWPKELQKYLIAFWYSTICYCLPFFGTYMFLVNYASVTWSANIIVGLLWLVLITNWRSFVINLVIGIILGIIYYKLIHGEIHISTNNMIGTYSNYISTVVIAVIFSRQKELIIKSKQLNLLHKTNTKLKNSLSVKLDLLYKTNTQLQNALSFKTQLLNNISHEIRTPVHGFTTISQGLVDHWNEFDNNKKFELAQNIASNANRLESLVGNLIDLSKLNNNKMVLLAEKIHIDKLIEDIIIECNTLYIKDKNITINFHKNASILATIDKEKIAQVLRNLFINAIKFTPSPGTIDAYLNATAKNIHFTITDNGVGIPEEELKMIFESFYQSSRTKTQAGGTGLGLSICKQIIKLHHGKIWANNNQGIGASFHFVIPINQNIR